MRWTKRVVTDPAAAANTPKRWFDSDETATHVLGSPVSAEAMVKLLSAENITLLHLIRRTVRNPYARLPRSRIARIRSLAHPQKAT